MGGGGGGTEKNSLCKVSAPYLHYSGSYGGFTDFARFLLVSPIEILKKIRNILATETHVCEFFQNSLRTEFSKIKMLKCRFPIKVIK